MRSLALLAATLGIMISGMTAARTTELKLVIGGSLAPLMKTLGPEFERASGHTLSIHFDSTPNVVKLINAGVPLDAVLVPADVFRDADARGHFVADSIADTARVGFGVIVRAGAPKSDISTAEAFKKTLLGASSVASTPSSAAGSTIAKVYERLGIAAEMKARTRAQAMPTDIAPAVARGDAELGIFLTNVFNAPDIELVGPFPPELQQELVFTSAVATGASEADAAKAFVDYLKTPAAIAAIKAAGMTPG
ncbi:MAG: substrate-binding domain-containing protein [Bradyrhizobium sp.]|uniref:molybdate ABC transporter substrate-binding protein n=1 Tax=Bradyrhizobium sp. TaxID=376 RepID=UPI001D87ACF2|nr:substrate-binding domain-containing protein [Bradyrhizobium sp.]MBV9560701.1 substrate-binding domain-containing protein [Bradyrhizobium sp.]